MSDSTGWVEARVRRALILLGAGAVLFLAGGALQRWAPGLPFDARIVSGLGILLLGVGLAQYITYHGARGDPKAASRKMIDERDERNVLLRARAGHRAFWVSLGLGYHGPDVGFFCGQRSGARAGRRYAVVLLGGAGGDPVWGIPLQLCARV